MPDYEIQFGKASLGNLKQNLDVGTMMFYAKPRVNLPKNLVVAMCSREISLDDHPINLKRHLLDNDLSYSIKIRWKYIIYYNGLCVCIYIYNSMHKHSRE